MEARGIRDQVVLATKFSTNYQSYKGFDGRINTNFMGNGTKSLHLSVRASLKKLRTDYIDVLWVHWCATLPTPSFVCLYLPHWGRASCD